MYSKMILVSILVTNKTETPHDYCLSLLILVNVDLSRLPETEGKELPPAVIMKLDVEGRVRKLFSFIFDFNDNAW